ncbi:rhomboid family intramembrane serine protease [Marinobacterium lutimaris]|uniref:GlpG protein n=1 Tax=Marinobacterium lutimaris TaxID=568106 RepID=A0A1H5U5D4_9GAMM|nr:rhomboid family intramembrane serine protease [Marinobacterium lutimaris]SEF70244.1 GlpG protein [Marinobacterium lutimaris]
MIPVFSAPLSEDLAPFTALLWEYEIPHRVIEEEGKQVLLVSPSIDPGKVRSLYQYWKDGGDLNAIEIRRPVRRQSRFGVQAVNPSRIPVTLALIALSVLATLLISFGVNDSWMSWLTFTNYLTDDQSIGSVLTMLSSGQWWRLVTPIFLHFSVLHILFNLLWVWVVGQRVEVMQGGKALLALVLVTGVASNLAQYLISGPLFGGMSGVVFGLLAYTWIWDRLEKRRRFGFPPALMGLMVLWLALGYTGVLEGAGMGAIANTAHLVGMLAGLAWYPIGRLFGPR